MRRAVVTGPTPASRGGVRRRRAGPRLDLPQRGLGYVPTGPCASGSATATQHGLSDATPGHRPYAARCHCCRNHGHDREGDPCVSRCGPPTPPARRIRRQLLPSARAALDPVTGVLDLDARYDQHGSTRAGQRQHRPLARRKPPVVFLNVNAAPVVPNLDQLPGQRPLRSSVRRVRLTDNPTYPRPDRGSDGNAGFPSRTAPAELPPVAATGLAGARLSTWTTISFPVDARLHRRRHCPNVPSHGDRRGDGTTGTPLNHATAGTAWSSPTVNAAPRWMRSPTRRSARAPRSVPSSTALTDDTTAAGDRRGPAAFGAIVTRRRPTRRLPRSRGLSQPRGTTPSRFLASDDGTATETAPAAWPGPTQLISPQVAPPP